MLNLNAQLGIHAEALKLRSHRAELIANNLANADTPDFKARDIDFRAALASAGAAGAPLHLSTSQSAHLGGPASDSATAFAGSLKYRTALAPSLDGNTVDGSLKYRTALAPSLDGNTVDVQVEQAAFAENAVRYQATLTFINSRLRGLLTAITGQ
jgi:flagellar basal-body rod protein FlgB